MEKYLHKNCDYTFMMLKENMMAKALASVQLSTICL